MHRRVDLEDFFLATRCRYAPYGMSLAVLGIYTGGRQSLGGELVEQHMIRKYISVTPESEKKAAFHIISKEESTFGENTKATYSLIDINRRSLCSY